MTRTSQDAGTGVRAREKRRTYEKLREAARELFEDRGYDDVTVAEIAARAGVSAKTLFQHFPSKEDLLLTELDAVHEELIRALGRRDRATSPLEAVTAWLIEWSSNRPSDGFDRFMRMVGTGPSVEAMRRRLYDNWENDVVAILADEANEARPTPRTRLLAAQLIAMIRVLSSNEVREFVERYPPDQRKQAHEACTREAAELLANGLDGDPAPWPSSR